jgi:hypothetical protein
MRFKDWKYAVDESAMVSGKGERYPYIESPQGERLWLADLDPRQTALAERLVEAANHGKRELRTTAAKARVTRKRRILSASRGRQRKAART